MLRRLFPGICSCGRCVGAPITEERCSAPPPLQCSSRCGVLLVRMLICVRFIGQPVCTFALKGPSRKTPHASSVSGNGGAVSAFQSRADGPGRFRNPLLATDHLLENTDRVGAPHQCCLRAAPCYLLCMDCSPGTEPPDQGPLEIGEAPY